MCAGLDQDSRGKPWETSSMLLGLSDKIVKKFMAFVMFVDWKQQKLLGKQKAVKEHKLELPIFMNRDV